MSESVLNMGNGYTMQTNIKRWGNSQGIRLSKEVLSQMDLKEDDTININVCDGKMTIEKANRKKYRNLEERLESFYKKPIDEIYVENEQEIDTGELTGAEIW